MAIVVCSERFDPAEAGYEDAVKAFMAQAAGKDGLTVEIRILAPGKKAARKQAANEKLAFLIKEHENWQWERGTYQFDFKAGVYLWADMALHITAGEALFLYRWLVLGLFVQEQWYFLRNIRSRYGTDFLTGVVHD
jgi:hypothetical protein